MVADLVPMQGDGGAESGAGESRAIGESLVSVPDPGVLATVGVPAWCDPRHVAVAWALSEGTTQQEAANRGGVHVQTVKDWLSKYPDFRELVKRLVPYTGLATRSGQLFAVKRLYQALKGESIDKRLRKSDEVHLIRLAGELGAAEVSPPVPQVRAAQAIFIGTQINVEAGATVMSPSGGPESAVVPGWPAGGVVDGEIVELGLAAGSVAAGDVADGGKDDTQG